MSRTLHIVLSLLLSLPAQATPTSAPAGRGTTPTATPTAPAAPSCGQNQAILNLAPPLAPNREASRERFDQQCSHARAGNSQDCDQTYFLIYRDLRNMRSEYQAACDRALSRPAGCTEAQAGTLGCHGTMAREAGTQLGTLAGRQQQLGNDLRTRQNRHLQLAREKARTEIAPGAPAITPEQSQRQVQQADRLFAQASGQIDRYPAGRSQFLDGCKNSTLRLPTACEHLAASLEAKYYGDRLQSASQITRANSERLLSNGNVTAERERLQGTPDNNTRTGTGTGMDMRDMIGLATLGVMGATAFCSITGKCSKKNDSGSESSLSGLDNQNTAGGTAPTPNSPNATNGTDTSETGNGGGLGNGGSGQIANNNGTDSTSRFAQVDGSKTGTGGGVPYFGAGGSGSGFEAGSGSPFGADRGLASGGGFGSGTGFGGDSGGAGAGGGGGGLQNTSTGASALGSADAAKSGENTYNPGGGAANSGGFSLGGSSSTTAADSALKSILNGDSPASALGDPLAASTSTDHGLSTDILGTPQQGAEAELMADPGSIFLRVRDTHQRCLKRGCVSIEVGQRI